LLSEINVSRGSVATYAGCGGIFNSDYFTANLPRNLTVKTVENRLRFDRIMAMSLWPHLFVPPCSLGLPLIDYENRHAATVVFRIARDHSARLRLYWYNGQYVHAPVTCRQRHCADSNVAWMYALYGVPSTVCWNQHHNHYYNDRKETNLQDYWSCVSQAARPSGVQQTNQNDDGNTQR